MRIIMLVLLLSCLGRSQTGDPLQVLLTEVKQLRQAIESMTIVSQRTQIMLSALQMQDVVVARSTARLEDVQKRCRAAELDRQRSATSLQRFENALAAPNLSDAEKRRLQSGMIPAKVEADGHLVDLQACQAAESEALGQLRNDRAKLSELQDRIDRLDRVLQQAQSGK